MLKTIIKYTLLVQILILGLQSNLLAFTNISNFSSEKNQESFSSFFDNSKEVVCEEFTFKPFSSGTQGIIEREPTCVEEDEDESASHKKYSVKNGPSIALFFAPALCYSKHFLKKHYYSYLNQFQNSTSNWYKLFEVFRL